MDMIAFWARQLILINPPTALIITFNDWWQVKNISDLCILQNVN